MLPTPSNANGSVPPNPTPQTTSRRGSIPKMPVLGGGGGGHPEDPASHLRKEMNLVAEAAKRASVAIVVRDLKDCAV